MSSNLQIHAIDSGISGALAYTCIPAPAPLAGMCLPSFTTNWQPWKDAGFRWIACLCSERPRYNPAPLEFLSKVELDDLYDGGRPSDPVREEKTIRAIAESVQEKLHDGEGVIIHCAGGRGRTGTVLGVVLVRLGHAPCKVIAALDRFHLGRGKPGWPESSWQKAVVERTHPA